MTSVKQSTGERKRCYKFSIKELHEEYKAWSLWPWQKLLDEKLEMTLDPRKIMWYWSEGGNVGKSGMALWLVAMKNACLLEPSKKADTAHVFASEPKPIVVFDCTDGTCVPSVHKPIQSSFYRHVAATITASQSTSQKPVKCSPCDIAAGADRRRVGPCSVEFNSGRTVAACKAEHRREMRISLAFEGRKPHLERQKGDTGPTEAETNGQGGEPSTAVGYCMKDGDFWEAGNKEDIKPLKMGQRTDLEVR